MRLKITKSKNSESLYVIKSFRVNGKSTSKIVKKLGKMNELLPLHNDSREDVIEWAREVAATMTRKEKEESNEIIVKFSQSRELVKDENTIFNGGYLFLQDIFYDLQLDRICKVISDRHNFEFNLTDILSKLIYSRILSPASKLSTYDYSKTFIEQPDFELHHIYRALDILEEESDFIQAELYKNSEKVIGRNTSVLYYDCTNFFFETEEAQGLKQYGKSKEHRPNPIVQMGLFMDGNGIPLSFVIFPGNNSEQPTLVPLEKKIIREFNLSKFIVCTDAGLASNDNRKFNNHKNRSYIVTQSLKKLKAHLREWALAPEGWKLNGEGAEYNINEIDECAHFNSVFYKERSINENDIEQRFIVSYSPKYKNYQSKIRDRQIERAKKSIASGVKINRKNPNSSSRFINEVKATSTGEVAKETYYNLDTDVIAKEMRYDGFYGVCTTLEDDIQSIININRRRWEIEESFRIMKTEFKSRPVYLQKDERIKAHFLTCYISLMVYRLLEKKIDEQYTSTQIVSTLKEMKFQSIRGEGYIPIYKRTDLTDKLHEKFKFRTDTQIVGTKKMKKIIKQTKK